MNPNQVPITITFNLEQINVVIESLGKMPYERVADLVNGIRSVALNALKEAEEQATSAQAQQSIELSQPEQAAE